MLNPKRVTAVLSAAVLSFACAKTVHPGAPRPVQVWRGGDDGLTMRFAAALEEAFKASPLFGGQAEESRTLVATIPTNLRWRDVGGRTRFGYHVVFSDHAKRRVGESRGVCWEDRVSECAARVRTDAERISAQLP